MNWVNFKSATQFGKPLDWDEKKFGPCGTLPVRVVWDDEHKNPQLKSYWRPTTSELAALQAGGAVELCIYSAVHPPVSMQVLTKVQGEGE